MEKKRIEEEKAEKIRQENFQIELERKNQIEKGKRLYGSGIATGIVFSSVGALSAVVGLSLGYYALNLFINKNNMFELGVASASLLGSAALFLSIGLPVLIYNGKKYKSLEKQTNLEIGLFNDNLYICLSTKF